MKVLSIDTSNYALGVGIIEKDKVIGEYITNMKLNHSVRVMPAIDMLIKDCGLIPADIDKIVVAKGPGSYTGVRIGVTIAKTLAWSLNKPLTGVSSLEILAASVGRYFDGYVSPIFDARRGQVYTGLYEYREGKLQTVKEDKLVMADQWASILSEQKKRILFVGNDLPIHRDTFESALGEQAIFAVSTEHNPRPAELALLGMDRQEEDVHTFVPNYIRLAEAEAKWLEANQSSGKGTV